MTGLIQGLQKHGPICCSAAEVGTCNPAVFPEWSDLATLPGHPSVCGRQMESTFPYVSYLPVCSTLTFSPQVQTKLGHNR
jgi:hypothetical protein